MAKSKSGGTRAYIRGRIGSDVYSVGKDGKGSRQQVVRSLAEQVSNPRTEAQMVGRMLMSTIMQNVSALAPIIDHSFDGVAKGQPSISKFIRENYALLKADYAAHPVSGNAYNYSKYQERGPKVGPYVVSKGELPINTSIRAASLNINITLPEDNVTVGGLKTALGLSADGYVTLVYVGETNGFQYIRAKLTTTLADSTAISAENVGSLFTVEASQTVGFYFDSSHKTVSITNDTVEDNNLANGIILSDMIDGQWKHSACTLNAGIDGIPQTASEALATYPTGSQQFLNGGQL